jgi:two-component system, NarL family, nitrate/nitrite response regulator NarL
MLPRLFGRGYVMLTTPAVRAAIIDLHPMFRAGVALTLSKTAGYELVAEGAGTDDAYRIARHDAPDVLILDLHSEFNVETLARLASEFPAMRTLILTVLADEKQVIAALRAGAAGYMLKGASAAELIESIRRVHRGETYVYSSLAARLMLGLALQRESKPDRLSVLTTREEQILAGLGHGLSNKEIARDLHLSEKTIKHYVGSLLNKPRVRNRVEAALLGQGRLNGKGHGNSSKTCRHSQALRQAST